MLRSGEWTGEGVGGRIGESAQLDHGFNASMEVFMLCVPYGA